MAPVFISSACSLMIPFLSFERLSYPIWVVKPRGPEGEEPGGGAVLGMTLSSFDFLGSWKGATVAWALARFKATRFGRG